VRHPKEEPRSRLLGSGNRLGTALHETGMRRSFSADSETFCSGLSLVGVSGPGTCTAALKEKTATSILTSMG
jgi:hypothetical protein